MTAQNDNHGLSLTLSEVGEAILMFAAVIALMFFTLLLFVS
jgi:hypothetical protein